MASMKVLGLKAQNLRNIDIVEVDLKGRNFVEITGDNGAAKSTLIDVLFGAMLGRKYFGGQDAWQVIQKGKDKAILKVVIGNREREIEIKRSITAKEKDDGTVETGGSLVITDTAGEKLGQEFLNSLITVFTVDVSGFSRLPVQEQVKAFYDILGIDLDAFKERRKALYEKRANVNRAVKELKAQIDSLPKEKMEAVDPAKILERLEEAEDHNERVRKEKDRREDAEDERDSLTHEIKETEEEIKRLTEEVVTMKNNLMALDAEMGKWGKMEEPVPVDAIKIQLAQAGEINLKAERYKERVEKAGRCKALMDEAEKMTKAMDGIDGEVKDALTKSNLPFKNLEVDPDKGLLISGIPFSQKSTAEQIRISTQIGMQMHPDLKILCIREGSLLDPKAYAVVKELADEQEYQVLVETVGEKAGEDQIVLRAGRIISEFQKETKKNYGEEL